MRAPTLSDYQEAIVDALSGRQIETLQTLYCLPASSATAKELAKELKYAGFQAASRQIGMIGKAISDYTGIVPPTYLRRGKEQPSFYLLIGDYTKAGWVMRDELQEALVSTGYVSKDKDQTAIVERLPTENAPYNERTLFDEGKVVQVFVNRYERNRGARRACINFFGHKCYACGFDFGEVYGAIAEGFIHVHHKNPLAEISGPYKVEPLNDLVPLCANCHSVVHLVRPAMSVEDLKEMFDKGAKRA